MSCKATQRAGATLLGMRRELVRDELWKILEPLLPLRRWAAIQRVHLLEMPARQAGSVGVARTTPSLARPFERG